MEKSPVRPRPWARGAFALIACALLCCAVVLASLAPASALAEEDPASAGFVTVSGAQGVDEAATYATFEDAASALVASPAVAEGATSVTLVVHGSVTLTSPVSLGAPTGALTVGIVSGDDAAQIVTSSGVDASLTTPACSLVVSGVSFVGPVRLSSAADLSIDGCSFSSTLTSSVAGVASVCANEFSTATGDARALAMTLASEGSSLTFSANGVYGYGAGLTVSLAEGAAHPSLSVTGNSFSLGGSAAVQPVLRIAGSPWSPSTVTFDGNDVTSATCLILLDASFGIENPQYAFDETLSRGICLTEAALDAPGIAGVFELVGRGSGDGAANSAVLQADASALGANAAAADIAAQASALLVPNEDAPAALEKAVTGDEPVAAADAAVAGVETAVPVATSAAFIVTYDANGASAGVAPEAVSVNAGMQASVATAGSLVNAGYEFRGWNTAADGSGLFYAVGQVFVPSSDVTLYAQWVPTGTVATVSVTSAALGA